MTYNYTIEQFTAVTGFYSVMAVFICLLFEYCLSSGNIFDFYGVFIKKLPNKLYKWLGGCVKCWSFTWLHIPIFVYRYNNTYLDTKHYVILFIWQYLLIFVGLNIIDYINLHIKRLGYDTKRIELLQWRMWREYKHDNTDTTSDTNQAEESRTSN